MKKLIALLLALVMIIGLVACGAKEEVAAPVATEAAPAATEAAPAATEEDAGLPYEGITLKFWDAPRGEADVDNQLKIIAEFEAETGAKVEYTTVPWAEFNTKFLAGFMAEEGPDVFFSTNDILYDLIDAGVVLDLSDYLTEEDYAQRNRIENGFMLGGQYALPYSMDNCPRSMGFNMDLLKAAGVNEVPETYEELIAAAIKVKEAGVCEYPLIYIANGGVEALLQTYIPVLYTNGGAIVSDDGKTPLLDSEASLKTAQYFYDLVHTHGVMSTDCTAIDSSQAMNLFREGKVAMCTVNTYTIWDSEAFFNVSDADGNTTAYDPFECIVTMGVANTPDTSLVCHPFDSISVSAVTENKDAAVALMQKLASKEAVDEYFADNPVKANLFADSPAKDIPTEWWAEMISQINDRAFGTPLCRGIGSIYDSMYANYQMLLMGELTPQECVDAMQAAAEAAIAG